MSWQEIETEARELLVDTVWNQWTLLGSMGRRTSTVLEGRVVDPEALVLATVACQKWEKRLTETLRWWAQEGSPLLSIQRMKKTAPDYGGQGLSLFTEYATLAAESGHRSWRKYADENLIPHTELTGPGLQLRGPSTLTLKLRAAFGVSAKTDVLAYLIGTPHANVSVPDASQSLGYTQNAVRSSLKEMTLAGLVHESGGRPAMYSTKRDEWSLLLWDDSLENARPTWVMWSCFFELLLFSIELQTDQTVSNQNTFLVNSRARDLLRKYKFAFDFHDIRVPDDSGFTGDKIQLAFSETLKCLGDWIREKRQSVWYK